MSAELEVVSNAAPAAQEFTASPNINASVVSNLTPADIDAFSRLGIPLELLYAAQVRRVTDQEARSDFCIKFGTTKDLNGIIFPYFVPFVSYRVTARLRRDRPETVDGKPQNKYLSAWGDHRHLYFPPDAAAKLDQPEMAILLVEAEKSVLAITAWAERLGTNVLPLGLGGCWGWRGRTGKADGVDGGRIDVKGPLLDLSVCDGRRVYVLLDNNVRTNIDVQAVRSALVSELRSRRCQVHVCDLPAVDGVNGPDDYIGRCGDDALMRVFEAARKPATQVAHCDYADGRFEVNDEGVVFQPNDDEEGNVKPMTWICSPLHVIAKTRSAESNMWGRLLKWHDPDGVPHSWAMPAELLQGDCVDIRRELAGAGLSLSTTKKARELLGLFAGLAHGCAGAVR